MVRGPWSMVHGPSIIDLQFVVHQIAEVCHELHRCSCGSESVVDLQTVSLLELQNVNVT